MSRKKSIYVGSKKKPRRSSKGSVLFVDAKGRKSRKRKGAGADVPPVILAVVAVLLLAALGYGLTKFTTFAGKKLYAENENYTIKKIDVRTGFLKHNLIKEWSGIIEGQNLFSFKLADLRRKMEAEPIIREVKVKRFFPDTVQIWVTERQAIARLGPDNSPIQKIIDLEGVVIRRSAQAGHLPKILGINHLLYQEGSTIDDPRINSALEAIGACKTKELDPFILIKSIQVGNPDFLDLRLSNGEQVKLPRKHIPVKLKKAAVIIQVAEERNDQIESIDLTPSADSIITLKKTS